MDEVVPVVLGAVLGFAIWHFGPGRARILLSIGAVVLSGVLATVFSGEYAESWIYLLLDLGEAAVGLALGFAGAHAMTRRRKPRRAAAPER
jgi:hypothetical protein